MITVLIIVVMVVLIIALLWLGMIWYVDGTTDAHFWAATVCAALAMLVVPALGAIAVKIFG